MIVFFVAASSGTRTPRGSSWPPSAPGRILWGASVTREAGIRCAPTGEPGRIRGICQSAGVTYTDGRRPEYQPVHTLFARAASGRRGDVPGPTRSGPDGPTRSGRQGPDRVVDVEDREAERYERQQHTGLRDLQ